MFLRIGWLVGWAGTWVALAITTLCLVVATLSALSMSAICTNGDTNGFSGGPYHLISRAAGPEYGHSCWHVVVFAQLTMRVHALFAGRYGAVVGLMFFLAKTMVVAVRTRAHGSFASTQ